MPSKVVKYHDKTTDVALFIDDAEQYWIGVYTPFAKHQNDEPSYLLIDGFFDTEEEGLAALSLKTGNEF